MLRSADGAIALHVFRRLDRTMASATAVHIAIGTTETPTLELAAKDVRDALTE